MTQKPFVLTRQFSAPVARVFQAWTDKDALKAWWGPVGFSMLDVSLDLKPNGKFHYGMKTPMNTLMYGQFEFIEIEAPTKLVFLSGFSDADGGWTRHPLTPTWPLKIVNLLELTPEDQGTRLTMTGAPFEASKAENTTFAASHHLLNQGFGGTLNQLEKWLNG